LAPTSLTYPEFYLLAWRQSSLVPAIAEGRVSQVKEAIEVFKG